MCCFFSADIEDLVSPVALSNRFVVSLHFEGMYHLRLQGSKSLWSMKIVPPPSSRLKKFVIHEDRDDTSPQNVRNQ